MRSLMALVLFALLLSVNGWTQTTEPADVRRTVSERLVGHFDSYDADLGYPVSSPDNPSV
jgi:hypothetical protein